MGTSAAGCLFQKLPLVLTNRDACGQMPCFEVQVRKSIVMSAARFQMLCSNIILNKNTGMTQDMKQGMNQCFTGVRNVDSNRGYETEVWNDDSKEGYGTGMKRVHPRVCLMPI